MPISLSARNVSHRFGNVRPRAMSIDVQAGRSTALVGESGSGKTTLLRCFNRLVEPDARRCLRRRHERPRTVAGVCCAADRLRATARRTFAALAVLRNVALVPTLLEHARRRACGRRALRLVGLPPA